LFDINQPSHGQKLSKEEVEEHTIKLRLSGFSQALAPTALAALISPTESKKIIRRSSIRTQGDAGGCREVERQPWLMSQEA
jgi:hypothetical protein